MNIKTKLLDNFNKSITNRNTFLSKESNQNTFEQICNLVITCYQLGGKVYTFGNGGSSSDSSHLAAELVGKINRKRPSLSAECLNTDTAVITAIANDYCYEDIFLRQLEAKLTKKDVVIVFSTSGNSKNVTKALKNIQEYNTVLLTGKDGGEAKFYSKLTLVAPGDTASEIQEIHETIYHTLVEIVESQLFFDGE